MPYILFAHPFLSNVFPVVAKLDIKALAALEMHARYMLSGLNVNGSTTYKEQVRDMFMSKWTHTINTSLLCKTKQGMTICLENVRPPKLQEFTTFIS